MRDEKQLKRTILQQLSPALVFSDLSPYKDAGKFVCICPRCGEYTLIAESGSDQGRCTGQACTYNTNFWDYIKDRDKLDDRETLERLAEIAGVPLNGQKTLADVFMLFFKSSQAFLMSEAGPAVSARFFLHERGFAVDAIAEFGFCLHPGDLSLKQLMKKHYVPDILLIKSGLVDMPESENKLLLPLKDKSARIAGFVVIPTSRDKETEHDVYLHNFGRGGHIFSEHLAHREINKTRIAIIAASAMEVCYLHTKGYKNALSIDGDTVQDIHVDYLLKFGAKNVLLCRKDRANCIRNSAINIFKRGIDVFKVPLPDTVGAALYVELRGTNDFNEIIRKAEPVWKWIASTLVADLRKEFHHVHETVLIDEAVSKAEEMVNLLRGSLYLNDFLGELSDELKIPVSSLAKIFRSEPHEIKFESMKDDLNDLVHSFSIEVAGYLENYRIDIVQDRASQLLYGCPLPRNTQGSTFKEFLRAIIERSKRLDYRGIENLLRSKTNPEKKWGR
ncbi:MAG: hypothetical protein HQL08_00605 [Nitrospirae bacterium]|nr:hypothetical protein [Nitrospirota bacterium]